VLQDLARGIAGQRVDEIDRTRYLVAGDALARIVDELLRADVGARLLDL